MAENSEDVISVINGVVQFVPFTEEGRAARQAFLKLMKEMGVYKPADLDEIQPMRSPVPKHEITDLISFTVQSDGSVRIDPRA
jgi:tellurite resistance-related uncharacterized protein